MAIDPKVVAAITALKDQAIADLKASAFEDAVNGIISATIQIVVTLAEVEIPEPFLIFVKPAITAAASAITSEVEKAVDAELQKV